MGRTGYVVADLAHFYKLALMPEDSVDEDGGAAPNGGLRHILVPKEGSWFLLNWPHPRPLAEGGGSPFLFVELIGASFVRR